jgi:hypothetical protein
MPLPSRLRELVGTARFWSDYYGDEVFGDSVAGLPEEPFLELPLSRRHALRVGYSFQVGGERYIAATSLQLRQADTGRDMLLGWHDAHRFPHVLPWEEADLIGRLWARRDPDLPHPGVPFLLLVPYVASIEGSDHLLGLRLVNRALRSLGVFTERQIRYRLSAFNRAPAESEWRRVRPYGWVCHSRGLAFHLASLDSGGVPIYSVRVAGDQRGLPRFPFDEWNDCMRRARRAVVQGGRPSPESAAVDPLPPLSRRLELCYQVTASNAARATIPVLRDVLFRRGLGVCHVFGSWTAFENQDDPHAELDHPNADAEYRLSCCGRLAEIVAVVRRVVEEAGRPEVRLYQRRDDEAGPRFRRIEL